MHTGTHLGTRYTAWHTSTHSQMFRHSRHRHHRQASCPRGTPKARDTKVRADRLSRGRWGALELLSCTPVGSAGRLGHRDPRISEAGIGATSTHRRLLWGQGPNAPLALEETGLYSPRKPALLSPEPRPCRAPPAALPPCLSRPHTETC